MPSWASIRTSLPGPGGAGCTCLTSAVIRSIVVEGTTIYAGTWGLGVWSRPISEMIVSSVDDHQSDAPVRFALDQNYPNPFNPSTTIRFAVSTTGSVVLSVHDVLGRKLRTQIDEVLPPGRYDAVFDGNELASGVYFYRIEAGTFSQTRKFVFQK